MQGTICKGIAGFYYVASEGKTYECKARGKFRNDRITPLVGDEVIFSLDENSIASDEKYLPGAIDEILPRINSFDRPPIANVETIVIVSATKDPQPLTYIIDRMAVTAEMNNAKVAICFNKDDIKDASELCSIYKDIYDVFVVSARTGDGIDKFKEYLRGKKAALCGPSGVGKSSLTNALLSRNVEVGDISKKTLRGKNTTRHSELFEGEGFFLFDTPGFTSFDTPNMDEYDLSSYFPEFNKYIAKCRFKDCTHQNEPDCAVKQALEAKDIHRSRYDSYLQMFKELKDSKRF